MDNSDMNNDIEINDKMQLTLPAIQLKYAGRVFRAYVKLLGDRAAYRVDMIFADVLGRTGLSEPSLYYT
jgi:hypothetical protein